LAVEDSAGVIRLVSTANGALVVRLESPEQTRLTPLSFTPDGTRLIAKGVDTEALHIWDLREVRRGLADIGLDWDEPPYPPLTPGEEAERSGTTPPLQVSVDPGELKPELSPSMKKASLDKVIADCNKAIERDPKLATAWSDRGHAYGRLGQWQKAIDDCSEAIKLNPKLRNAWSFRGAAHIATGRLEKAAIDYESVMKLEPQNDWYWYPTAALRLRIGDVKAYQRICQETLERFRNTDKPEIMERLAITCLLIPQQPGELGPVLRLADRAVTGTERHRYYRWFLRAKGLAEYRAGHDAGAVDWLNRFAPRVNGNPSDATVFSVLAMAQHHLGRAAATREALGHAEAILARMPDPCAGRPFGQVWPYRVQEYHDWLHACFLCQEARTLLGMEINR
jgi:tetratricopeptide (TPR) repeat protein